MWVVGLVVLGIGVAIAIGAAIQAARGSEGQIIGPAVPPPDACADFCRDLQLARTIRCNAEARERALAQELANLRSLVDRTLVTAGILTAAAVAVAAIPFIGGFISASLWAAAATAFALYFVLLGMVVVAHKQWTDQWLASQAARDHEADARSAMILNCPDEEWLRCLANLTPC